MASRPSYGEGALPPRTCVSQSSTAARALRCQMSESGFVPLLADARLHRLQLEPHGLATVRAVTPPVASNALDDPQPAPAQAPWTAGVREPRAGEFFGVVLDIDVQQTFLEFNAQVDDPGTLSQRVRHQLSGQQGGVVDHLVGDAPTIEQPFKKRPPSGRRIWPARHLGVSNLWLSVSPVHDLTPQSVGDAATKSPPRATAGTATHQCLIPGDTRPERRYQAGTTS